MPDPDDKFKNYNLVSFPNFFGSGSPNFVSIMICKKCGAIVGDVDIHDRWHHRVTFTNL